MATTSKCTSEVVTNFGFFWFYENNKTANILDAKKNMESALRMQLGVRKTEITHFRVYGNSCTKEQLMELQNANINFINTTSAQAAYKAIITDMFLFAMDNPIGSYIILITKEKDTNFTRALTTLRTWRYRVVVAFEEDEVPQMELPCDFCCSWEKLVGGSGFVQSGSVNLKPNDEVTQSPSKKGYYVTGIFWDMQTCPYPNKDIQPGEMLKYIKNSLEFHPLIKAENIIYSRAFEDPREVSYIIRKGLDGSGMKFVPTIANNNKVLVEVLKFALLNPPPCNIMIISCDESLSNAICSLRQRGFTMFLATTSGNVSYNNVASFLFRWPDSDKDFDGSTMWTKPNDLSALKRNMEQLFKHNNGELFVYDVSSRYQKMFMRPLAACDYGFRGIDDLLKHCMRDILEVKNVDKRKKVFYKKQLQSEDVELGELKRFLEDFGFAIPLSSFHILYNQQVFTKSLEDYIQEREVNDIQELFEKMPEVAVFVVSGDTKQKCVMSAPLVKIRRARLKVAVSKLLNEYGIMPVMKFDEYYKRFHKETLNYIYYGLTNLEDLCKVFEDLLEVQTLKEVRCIKLLPSMASSKIF